MFDEGAFQKELIAGANALRQNELGREDGREEVKERKYH